jgi:DNA-binding transcriptional regulator YiaG
MDQLVIHLKHARTGKGHSQEQAAHEMGVTVGAVHLWESGKRIPTGLSRRAIEQYIETSQEAPINPQFGHGRRLPWEPAQE